MSAVSFDSRGVRCAGVHLRGETDAFAASEFPLARGTSARYDRVLAITRSGTTSEAYSARTSATGI